MILFFQNWKISDLPKKCTREQCYVKISKVYKNNFYFYYIRNYQFQYFFVHKYKTEHFDKCHVFIFLEIIHVMDCCFSNLLVVLLLFCLFQYFKFLNKTMQDVILVALECIHVLRSNIARRRAALVVDQ